MAYQGLSAVEFGHIAAEDEASVLRGYFVETKEFSDVVSDKSKLLVIGRKGSGKSAIYVAVRDFGRPTMASAPRRWWRHRRRWIEADEIVTMGGPIRIVPVEQDRLATLRQVLIERFSNDELRILSFDLGIDYDGLLVEGKANKALELIRYLERRNRIPDLVAVISKQRPDISLNSLLEGTEKATLKPRGDLSRRHFSGRDMARLQNIIYEHFDGEDIRTLCFQMGVDYDTLLGEGRRAKVRELVLYLWRREQISELVDIVRRARPNISWEELFDEPDETPPVRTSPPEQLPPSPQEDDGAVVEALTLQEYPWEIHKRVRDTGLPAELAYVSSWKYIVWVLLAKKVLSFGEPARYRLVDPLFWRSIFNANIRYLRRFLRQNYGSIAPSFVELIADRARRIRSLKVKDFELGADEGEDPSQRLGRSINFLNLALQDHVLAILLRERRYYLLFDQLDLGWDGTEETKQLLIGLIIAARDVMRAAEKAGKRVRVVLFLRSDIYESLRFEDKNKLSPSVVELRWNERRLKQLVSKRIEVSANGTWEDVFADQCIMEGKPQLDYIVERTMLRPRDMIQFCVCARDAALRLGRDRVDSESIVEACRPYSDYMRREIQDECKASAVEVDGLLAVLQEIGQERFTKRQFAKACKSRGIDDRDSAMRQLLNLSVLGVCRSSSRVMYRYQATPWDRLDPTEELVVHPSLKYALGLVGPGEK